MNTLVKQLIDNFIYQKEKLLKRAGARTALNKDRMRVSLTLHMEKLALIIQDWDVDAALVIEAAFNMARINKHPDGPLPNMLCSVKWLTKALSLHMDLPWEVIAEKRSKQVLMEKLDEEYERLLPSIMTTGVNVHLASTIPVEYRFLACYKWSTDRFAMKQMAPDLLKRIESDRKTAMWLETKGLTYEYVAKVFNE